VGFELMIFCSWGTCEATASYWQGCTFVIVKHSLSKYSRISSISRGCRKWPGHLHLYCPLK
jgi:hypothetical protein